MTVLERWAAAHMDRSVTCYATLQLVDGEKTLVQKLAERRHVHEDAHQHLIAAMAEHDCASARREVAEALATAEGPDRAYWWQMMVAIETVIGEAD